MRNLFKIRPGGHRPQPSSGRAVPFVDLVIANKGALIEALAWTE